MISTLPQPRKVASALKTPFQRSVFDAAVKSFNQTGNPLRLNNFATNLRELSRIMLADLAPDKNIKACGWFVQQYGNDGKPFIERAQRIKYAVQAGLPDDFVQDTLEIDIGKTSKRFLDLLNRMSKFTHVGEKTFDSKRAIADDFAREALDAFLLLFRTIELCRARVVKALETHADEALIENLILETVQELDEIATHYYVTGSGIERLRLESMDNETIRFSVSGYVDCQQQYGSDTDVERGDGLRTHGSYPLKCQLEADIGSPSELAVSSGSLSVYNSSFYE